MSGHPDAPPPFWDRRRLLLALSAGAVNVAVLDRLDFAVSARPTTGSALGPGSTGSLGRGRTPAEPVGYQRPTWPRAEPPAMADALPPPGADHVFDLVIAGGRVIDPDSGFDGLADVGIDGDRITTVAAPDPGSPLQGRDRLEVSGRVVAPGFVDLLSAEPNSFGSWLKLADGVTTNLAMHGVNNYARAFFRRYQGQTPVHYGGAFHHHFLRAFDVGAKIDEALTARQMRVLVDLAARNLDDGFGGVCFSPEYSPGTTTAEMTAVAEVAAERDHVCFFHVRHSDPNPPGTSLEAIEEVLTVAANTGVSVHIEHLTSTGGTHVMDQAISLIDAGRSAGLDITACVYPYDFWGTYLASERFSPGWRQRHRLGPGDLQIAGTDIRLTEETLAWAIAENKLVAALGSIPEYDIQRALVQPWAMVASDAIPTVGTNNHPRGAGTFSRTLARYVRELGVVDLMTGLAKLTILPARRVERMMPPMRRKGRLQRGADADLVVFDPVRVRDRATVRSPAVPSAGIEQVIVGGQRALVDGEPDRSVRAGLAIRAG